MFLLFSVMQRQLADAQAEAMNLHRANEGLAGPLVEGARLRDESAAGARSSASIAWINSDRYMALQEAAAIAIKLVLPVGPGFHERLRGLPAQIKELVAHHVCQLTSVVGPRWTCTQWSPGSQRKRRCPMTSMSGS